MPFALFGRTAFLAERVLGHVIACGVKVMVLAVIVGIGSSLFVEFTQQASGQPTLEEVLAMALAALTLLGLSIFGPGVASGLVSGAPQLGAGAAVGTGLTVAGMAMVGAGAAQMAAGGAGQALAAAGAGGPGGPRPGPGSGSEPGPGPGSEPGSEPGPGGPPPTKGPGPGGGAAKDAGAAAQASPSGGEPGSGTPSAAPGEADPAPAWARDLKRQQALAHGASLAVHGLASGDDHGAGASPSLSEQS